jgi:hypothetical protein
MNWTAARRHLLAAAVLFASAASVLAENPIPAPEPCGRQLDSLAPGPDDWRAGLGPRVLCRSPLARQNWQRFVVRNGELRN